MRQVGRPSWYSLPYLRLARLAFQPILGCRESGQAGDRGAKVDRLPLGVEASDLQLVDPTEEVLGEPGDALISIGSGRPIVGHENGGHRNGGNALIRLHQGRIVA